MTLSLAESVGYVRAFYVEQPIKRRITLFVIFRPLKNTVSSYSDSARPDTPLSEQYDWSNYAPKIVVFVYRQADGRVCILMLLCLHKNVQLYSL